MENMLVQAREHKNMNYLEPWGQGLIKVVSMGKTFLRFSKGWPSFRLLEGVAFPGPLQGQGKRSCIFSIEKLHNILHLVNEMLL
jgi:hypothetical protein